MMSRGFTEEEFDALLQSCLVSTDTKKNSAGSPSTSFNINEFLTSFPKKKRRTSNDEYLSENRDDGSYVKGNDAKKPQLNEGSEGNNLYPKNKRTKYDSFEEVLQDCLKAHENSPNKPNKEKKENSEFDEDFLDYILEITQTKLTASPTSIGSKQTNSLSTPGSKPVEMLRGISDTSVVTVCDKVGNNKAFKDPINSPVKVKFELDEKENKEENREVRSAKIDCFVSVETLRSPLKESQQQNTDPNHEGKPKTVTPQKRVVAKNLLVSRQLNFTEKSVGTRENLNLLPCNLRDLSPNNKFPAQYQNLETLVVFLQRKIRDIHAFQRKSTLRINHGRDSDNFTDNLLEAIGSEENMQKLEHSQQMLSQETVTFSPKIVRLSSLKCSGSSQGSQKTPETTENHLTKALEEIVSDESLVCSPEYWEWEIPTEITDRKVMQKILEIFNNILNDMRQDTYPSFQVRNQRVWSNGIFQNNRLMLKCKRTAKKTVIRYNRVQSRRRFESIVWILAKIVDLVILNKSVTKRELYYQMKDHFKKYAIYQTDSCVHIVSGLLDLAPWDFHVFAANKGLVYGDLIVTFSNGDVLVCDVDGGAAIPQKINDVIKVQTDASFILVIEKDAIFQELTKQNLPNKLGCSLIMVTGKGYADMNTRMFIKKIWQTASIPVFVLVDCDPYGIEIMLNYRFGSLAQAHLAHKLALPEIRWLGVFPSEIVSMNIKRHPLTDRDKSKIGQLLQRPYIDAIPTLRNELDILLRRGFKGSIEGAVKGNTFLRDYYLYVKLCNKNFV